MKNLARNIIRYLISCGLLFVVLGLPSAWEAQPNYSDLTKPDENQKKTGDIDNMQTASQSNAANTNHQGVTDQETKRDMDAEESDLADNE